MTAPRASESDSRAFIRRLADALRPLDDPCHVQAEAARLAGTHLGVHRASYAEIDGEWAVIRGQHVDGVAPLPARIALAGFGEPLLAECRAGGVIAIEDARIDPPAAGVRGAFEALQVRAVLAVTVIKAGRWVAIFGVGAAAPRAWTGEERDLVCEVAERAWAAAEQLRAEVSLRESDRRQRQLFEMLDDAVTVVELIRDGLGTATDWRYLFANPALERQRGLRPEQVVGRRASELFPDDYRQWLPTLAAVAETQQPIRLERGIRSLGRTWAARILPYGRDRCVALYHDITTRTEAETALQAGAARQAYLLKLADALRPLHATDDIQYEAACVLGEHLAATRVFYADVVLDRASIRIARNWTRGVAPSVEGRYPLSMFAWIEPMFAAGQVVAVDDAPASALVSEAARPALAGIDAGAFIAAPLVKGGRLVAALSVVEAVPRAWTRDEIQLVEETAERTWAAVERARAESALQHAKEVLEERVLQRTAQLATSKDALEREVRERRLAEQQVKTLFRRLVATQEAERQRVARDIHDQVGQQMTALRMFLDALVTHTAGNEPLSAAVERTRRLAEDLDRTIEFLTWQLRPSTLEHLGLAASLGDLVRGWGDRFGIAAEFQSLSPGLRLAAEVEDNLYRLTQEALHNIVKHAQAQHVSVVLSRRDDYAMLVVEDDGRGFDVLEAQASDGGHRLGLISMRERATLVGGELEIDSKPGRGTAIFVRVPIGPP